MNPTLIDKLEGLRERFVEVGALLAEQEIASNPARFRSLAKEHAELSPIVECFVKYNSTIDSIEDAREFLTGTDPDMRALALEEIDAAQTRQTRLESELKVLLLPVDPADASNVYLEIRAGTGGDEAALFAGDLLKMYLRFSEHRRWKTELVSESHGEHGRIPGGRRQDCRPGRLLPAQVRVRRPPGAARAGDRVAGAHPYVRRAPSRCCPRQRKLRRSRLMPPI